MKSVVTKPFKKLGQKSNMLFGVVLSLFAFEGPYLQFQTPAKLQNIDIHAVPSPRGLWWS